MIETCWCGSEATRDEFGELWCTTTQMHDPTYRELATEPKSLYVSGPMTGLPECNYPAFHEAAQRLREAGYEVRNPAEEGDLGSQYTDLMRKDLKAILEVEGIATIEGWWGSKGAMVEITAGGAIGLPVRSVDEWIQRNQQLDAPANQND